jgi:DNA-binding GntR family transcriptional regulator
VAAQPASLSARAYHLILQRILTGAVPLGGELSRRRLAAELGMSILPVAEALQRLQNEGIVETQPRVGTRVRVPTPADVRERYEVREALETQTARLFCRVAKDADRDELRLLAERVDTLYSRCFQGGENEPEFIYQVQETHAAFHLRVAEVGGCRALHTMLEVNHVLTYNGLYHVAASLPLLPEFFHSQVAEALCTKDEEAADRAMRLHVRYGIEQVIRGLPVDVRAAAAR